MHLFCSDPAPRNGLRGATSHADLVSLGSQMRPAVSTNDLSSAGGYGYSGPLSSRGARGARWSMYGADRPTPHGSVLFAVIKRKFPKVSVGARGRVDLVPRRKETRRRSCTAVSPAQAVLTWGLSGLRAHCAQRSQHVGVDRSVPAAMVASGTPRGIVASCIHTRTGTSD